MDPSWIQGHYSAEWWLGPGLEKAERKSAMAGSLLKNSWLGRGCSREMVLSS